MKTVLNKHIFLTKTFLCKSRIKQTGNWLYRSDDICISSIEETEAKKGISPKYLYTGNANFWTLRTIFESFIR
jgi:hypothetical protein